MAWVFKPLQQGTSNPRSQERGCRLCLLVPLTTTRLQRVGVEVASFHTGV